MCRTNLRVGVEAFVCDRVPARILAFIDIAFFVEAVLPENYYYECCERVNTYPDILDCPMMRISRRPHEARITDVGFRRQVLKALLVSFGIIAFTERTRTLNRRLNKSQNSRSRPGSPKCF